MTDIERVHAALADPKRLVRAIASGRRPGTTPDHIKTELRPVDIKGRVRLQITRHGDHRPTVQNVDYPAATELSELLDQPYRHWLVETVDSTMQLRFTKRGKTQLHVTTAERGQNLAHDRVAPHLIAADDALFGTLGASAAKRRQVDAFLRAIAPVVGTSMTGTAPDAARNATSPDARALTVADLGCGNAYLTFAMHRHLSGQGIDCETIGVDVRDDQRRRNTGLAQQLGWSRDVRFVAGSISDAPLPTIDIVLALHACDTATDDALARGVELGARYIFAAPCCHHDIAAQLRNNTPPTGYRALTADGILRERFADVLTDALRADLLRLHGYTVDVIEFIDSAHTPRNTLIRATRTDNPPTDQTRRDYESLIDQWRITPYLATLLKQVA